jgi:phage shock protein E
LEIVGEEIPAVVPDKSAPVFLHCQSGVRSATARRKLKAIGYTQVFNLGSLARARSLCEAAGRK